MGNNILGRYSAMSQRRAAEDLATNSVLAARDVQGHAAADILQAQIRQNQIIENEVSRQIDLARQLDAVSRIRGDYR